MTNAHVVGSRAEASLSRLSFYLSATSKPLELHLDPDTYFFSSPYATTATESHLDYTVVAVRDCPELKQLPRSFVPSKVELKDGHWLTAAGYPDLDPAAKPKGLLHQAAEFFGVHFPPPPPAFEPMQLSFHRHETTVVDPIIVRFKTNLYKGSSGGPCFLDNLEVAGVANQLVVNEDHNRGICISAIIADIEAKVFAAEGKRVFCDVCDHIIVRSVIQAALKVDQAKSRLKHLLRRGTRSRVVAALSSALTEEKRTLQTGGLTGIYRYVFVCRFHRSAVLWAVLEKLHHTDIGGSLKLARIACDKLSADTEGRFALAVVAHCFPQTFALCCSVLSECFQRRKLISKILSGSACIVIVLGGFSQTPTAK